MSNMELWNKVCKTDPKYAKKVEFGRAFTAIDPMYQVRKATETFGAAGKHWGFEFMEKTILPTDFVAVTVRVWIEDKANYIDHVGMCGLYTDNKKTKPDSDCMKKAMTDGITKGLSYFGFSADVFLGQFDDSRYVEGVRREIAAGEAAQEIIKEIKATKNQGEFLKLTEEKADLLKRLEGYKDIFVDVQNALNEQGAMHEAGA